MSFQIEKNHQPRKFQSSYQRLKRYTLEATKEESFKKCCITNQLE